MNKTIITAGFIASIIWAAVGSAGKPNVVFAAAKEYDEAVAVVDSVVSRTRAIRRADRDLVNRLQRATKRMVVVAKNPRNVSRLRFERKKVLPLQMQLEARLFENYRPNLELVTAWEYLLCTQAVFENELAFFIKNPRRGNSTQRRIESSQPNRYLAIPSGYPPLPGVGRVPGPTADPTANPPGIR